MSETFDIVVIGGGPAGENAGGCAATGGLSVALVEAELLGGECSYWACIPSKALLRPAEARAAALRVPGVREAVQGDLDVDAVLARRDAMVHDYDDASQVRWAEGAGLTVVRGHGRLSGERTVEVKASDGGVRTLTARRAVVLATGSTPVIPSINGLAEIRPWDSRDVTSAKEVPERLLVIGGGVVGVEMAWAWRSLGSREVTVLVRGDRLLAREEPVAGETLAAAFVHAGIDVRFHTELRAARRDGDGPVAATLSDGTELVADEVLVATGRRPRIEDIGLETIGLSAVEVDEQLRVRGVDGGWLYAVGDVNGLSLLTHMGKYQARVVGKHLADPATDPVAMIDDGFVTRVVFTDPNVAAVGLTEAVARERGMNVRVAEADLSDTAGAAERGEGVSGPCKLVVDEDRRVIVGATFIGPEAADLLHAATVALVGEIPVDRLRHAVPAFPTVSEVWLSLLSELRVPAG
jgi:pyruvate/2-oxoglutarate dehydrogenase complex dihydrolipoamide dehydrogenase (E3) component